MGNIQYLRHDKSKRVTMATRTLATVKLTTSLVSTAINVSGYKEMAVCARITANNTAAPGLYLQVSGDGGTNWSNSITIKADMTTTANYPYAAVTNFGDTVRVMCKPATTTSRVSYSVLAVLKV